MANLMDMDIYCVKNMKMKRSRSLASLADSSLVSWHCGRTGQNTIILGIGMRDWSKRKSHHKHRRAWTTLSDSCDILGGLKSYHKINSCWLRYPKQTCAPYSFLSKQVRANNQPLLLPAVPVRRWSRSERHPRIRCRRRPRARKRLRMSTCSAVALLDDAVNPFLSLEMTDVRAVANGSTSSRIPER